MTRWGAEEITCSECGIDSWVANYKPVLSNERYYLQLCPNCMNKIEDHHWNSCPECKRQANDYEDETCLHDFLQGLITERYADELGEFEDYRRGLSHD